MDKIKQAAYTDFYFNGHWLSEFNGMVAGLDGGLKKYPLIAGRSYTTDHAINQDGETVYGSRLEPLPFTVPVFFENITPIGLRKIAAWLDCPNGSLFHYKEEEIGIYCRLDSSQYDVEAISGINVYFEIKFIAYHPIFTAIEASLYCEDSVIDNKLYYFNNNSTYDVYPKIKLLGNGDISVKSYTFDEALFSQSKICSVIEGIILDCHEQECTLLNGTNHFYQVDKFIQIPKGEFYLSFQNVIQFEIEYYERYL